MVQSLLCVCGGGALTEFADYFADACYQALVYWIMSALTNDPWTLARFAGLYKAVQSAGAAGSFGMDAVSTPWLNELVSLLRVVRTSCTTDLSPQLASWIMMLFSFPLAFLVLRTVKETNYDQEEVVYVDDVKQGALEQGTPDAASIEKEGVAGEEIKS